MIARTAHVIEIRDRILALMETTGAWTNVAGCRMRSWQADAFRAVLATPFNPLPLHHGGETYSDGLLRELSIKQAREFPYLLDLWFERRKVLSIEWNAESGATHIISFRRGEWEGGLLETAGHIMDEAAA